MEITLSLNPLDSTASHLPLTACGLLGNSTSALITRSITHNTQLHDSSIDNQL